MSNYMILQSDARRIPLADKSVQCVTTSPPYWGLRDYGTEGQIGLESTPEEYVDVIRKVFAEVWRVLRDDGVVFLNLGDSYASKAMGYGLKPKDLVGIPWRAALALQSDGWYLRSDIIEEVEFYCPCGCGHVMEERVWRHAQDRDIIWRKPNPMPESVTDRPTKAHEYVFLLTKGERYFYDADAVKEGFADHRNGNPGGGGAYSVGSKRMDSGALRTGKWNEDGSASGRNLRSVWTIASQPYPGAHFATMPIDLATRCIKAGTSEKGCCPHCGSPYQRITERTQVKRERPNDYTKRSGEDGTGNSCANTVAGVDVKTVGWERTCKCPDAKPGPCVVLDPFSGAATTGVAALALNRDYIGLENNPEYIAQSVHRIERPHAKRAVQVATNDDASWFGGLTL